MRFILIERKRVHVCTLENELACRQADRDKGPIASAQFAHWTTVFAFLCPSLPERAYIQIEFYALVI